MTVPYFYFSTYGWFCSEQETNEVVAHSSLDIRALSNLIYPALCSLKQQ